METVYDLGQKMSETISKEKIVAGDVNSHTTWNWCD